MVGASVVEGCPWVVEVLGGVVGVLGGVVVGVLGAWWVLGGGSSGSVILP